jgi:hypothetical protein
MPDLLAHALVAYTLCRLLSWRYAWFETRHVTAGMAGAFVPDLAKIELVVSADAVVAAIGVPVSWLSLHTGGGVAVSVLVGVVLLAGAERRHAGLALALGAGSHLLADSLLLTPSGRTTQLLWPLAQYRTPSPGLYLSTEPGPTVVAGLAALTVWLAHRSRGDTTAAGDDRADDGP